MYLHIQFKDEFPKAPPTAYMLFHRRKVPSLKAKYPNHNMKDVAKILGESTPRSNGVACPLWEGCSFTK